jgi:hypothetical protein
LTWKCSKNDIPESTKKRNRYPGIANNLRRHQVIYSQLVCSGYYVPG